MPTRRACSRRSSSARGDSDAPTRSPRVLARAWDVAQAGRPGPVLVSVPMDILTEPLDAPIIPASPLQKTALDPSLAEEIARQLERAERPFILAGGGTRRATAELVRLAEAAQVPVGHTLDGRGSPASRPSPTVGHGRLLGQSGRQRLASTADLILAVGTRFPETDSSSWEHGTTFAIPPTRLIQIDIDPNEPGRNYPTSLAVVADAEAALSAIADRARPPSARAPRFDWQELQAERRRFLDLSAEKCPLRGLPDEAGADPCRPSPGRSRRDPRHRRRLEQERDGSAVPDR